ncbi:MAG: CoA transferase [bacterium]|nr:CoA transferase [bacterium]MDE0287122.1 CoA transferase [bacterium]MDE0437554.1 CoA transferase [bacterium]
MQEDRSGDMAGPLAGLRVIDAATLFAGPMVATLLGDYGADVIKVEHPAGDSLRNLGWEKDGVSLWWAVVNRNKRAITLKLSHDLGRRAMLHLVEGADVLVENFRPGTMERWGLGWDDLCAVNPRLIMVRVTGFGQTGPYRERAGFGTLAESMSGFAHINGHPGGPPTLPPFALADGIAGLSGAFLTMAALRARDLGGGTGQVIDLSIYEPIFWLLGPQATIYDQLGIVQGRTGNRAPFTAPRNAYLSRDGVWLGLSGSSQSTAERTVRLVGRPEMAAEPWFANHAGRLRHQDELDEAIGAWVGARDAEEVVVAFSEAGAAIAPILDIAGILEDPQFVHNETVTTVEDPVLGPVRMQNLVGRMSGTPGRVRTTGPSLGEHNRDILGGLIGYGDSYLRNMAEEGVISFP